MGGVDGQDLGGRRGVQRALPVMFSLRSWTRPHVGQVSRALRTQWTLASGLSRSSSSVAIKVREGRTPFILSVNAIQWASSALRAVSLGENSASLRSPDLPAGSGQPHEAAGVEPRAYLSFLLSILLGCAKNLRPLHMWPQLSGLEGAGDLHRRFWRAHIALVDLAGRALAAAPAPSPGGLLGFLAPALVRELAANERQVGARGWYGLVQVALRSAKGKTGALEPPTL